MIEWGTLLPNGNVCKWDNEAQARQAALMSESFPDGAHSLVSRECSEWAPVKPEPDVTECPDCGKTGRYDGRVLVGGRGVYRCRCGAAWQDQDEKPTNKGLPISRTS